MPPNHPWMSPAEVAKVLGVEVSTVTRWIRAGRLAAITLPSGKHKVSAEAVEAILKTPTVEAAS